MWKSFSILQKPANIQYEKLLLPLLLIYQPLQLYIETERDFSSIKNICVTQIKVIPTYLQIIYTPRL